MRGGRAVATPSLARAHAHPTRHIAGTYQCSSAGVMRSATMWLGIVGGMIMCVLMAKGVRGSMIVGIRERPPPTQPLPARPMLPA